MSITRRLFFAGLMAAAIATGIPAFGQTPSMPTATKIETNGVKLVVYEAGAGPAVVLLHGFPGLGYTWRHQIPALVAAGYRVIVPDLRGYGQSDAPADVEAYDVATLTNDVAGLMDKLGVDKAVFMGHDWGGLLAWQMALLHKERVAGVIALNTPYEPHWALWLRPEVVGPVLPEGKRFVANPQADPIAQMRQVYSPEMYVLQFHNGKVADDAMNKNVRGTLRYAYRKDLMRASEWNKLPPSVANMEYYGTAIPQELPGQDVLTPDELDVYTENFERTGFTPAINWYRNISRNWKAGINMDQNILAPALIISAEHDVVLRPSMVDGMEKYVPNLEKHVIAGAWHWTPEEKPDEVNRLAISWLNRHYKQP